ncbi:MAG: hypothetical protein RBJ76_18180 [Stenomitos frigidus ULC029]
MASPRFLQLLHRTGWEFWLPLPLIAALFGLAGNFVAATVLSRPYDSVGKLRAELPRGVKLPVTILAINAVIDRRRGMTTIALKTANSTLKKPTYTFPVTQASQIEVAIAQQLNMSVAQVRKLTSYRIMN